MIVALDQLFTVISWMVVWSVFPQRKIWKILTNYQPESNKLDGKKTHYRIVGKRDGLQEVILSLSQNPSSGRELEREGGEEKGDRE